LRRQHINGRGRESNREALLRLTLVERRAGEMHAMLHFTRMEEITAIGLPRFLEQFLARLRDLGDRIASDFLLPPAEA